MQYLNITITANEALKAANVTVFGITHMMIVTGKQLVQT